jgi:hypothetical protein
MDRKKQLVFKYFDIVFSGYKKHGRRPVNVSPPHILFEYMNNNGVTAFEYDTENQSIRFNYDDFYSAKNMFGITVGDLVDICKQYVSNTFNKPEALKTTFFPRRLN